MSTKRTSRRTGPEANASRGERVGVWIFGALGGLATTLVVGARAIAKGRAGHQGLLTESELCAGLDLVGIDRLVFGGHEVRAGTPLEAAREIHAQDGTIPHPLLEAVRSDLSTFGRQIRPGCLVNAGATIRRLAGKGRDDVDQDAPLRAQIDRLQDDVRTFIARHRLRRCICVNLVSTEPKLKLTRTHERLAALDKAIDRNQRTAVRPSTLYAYVAASIGLPLVHFTPSNAALIPAVRELFDQRETPYMGSDGKTGETLVKSALAPMFKYRNLRVLTWQGYNMLGDRDGIVLADAENKATKVESKDHLLAQILGYPLHTKVSIDYVPSLGDLKTAWDFVHFEGFLGHRMTMQFTWQGCDSVLAAPLVLDMVRLSDLAQRRGENGPMRQLACFFKSPVDVAQHDLHAQWHGLVDYLQKSSAGT